MSRPKNACFRGGHFLTRVNSLSSTLCSSSDKYTSQVLSLSCHGRSFFSNLLSSLSKATAGADFHRLPSFSLLITGAAATHGLTKILGCLAAKEDDDVDNAELCNDACADDPEFETRAPLTDAEAILWVAIKVTRPMYVVKRISFIFVKKIILIYKQNDESYLIVGI